MGGDDFEIDLTADAPPGFLPIRWVGPGDSAPATEAVAANGNGHTTIAPTNRNSGDTTTAALPARRIVTLASFIPPTPLARLDPPVITLVEPDSWRDPHPERYVEPQADPYSTITVRRALASRGARFLAVVVVVLFVGLIAGGVLLWDRVEQPLRPQPIVEPIDAVTQEQLVEVQSRLNGLETKISSLVDATGAAVQGGPVPAELAFQLAALRSCVAQFQHAIDVGLERGGQFPLCG